MNESTFRLTLSFLAIVTLASCSPDPGGTQTDPDMGVTDAAADTADTGNADDADEPSDASGVDTSDTSDTSDAGRDAAPDVEADTAPSEEICGNDADDDGDGDTDCMDDECSETDACLAVSVTASETHACAVTQDGRVHCWGHNRYGQLGNGEEVDDVFGPVEVTGIDDAVEVTAGSRFTCARHQDGSVSCWGVNSAGELGDSSTIASPVPVEVSGIDDAVQISAGQRHTCARLSTGNVMCWGLNSFGELGDGTEETFQTSPQQVRIFAGLAVVDLDDAVDVSCGVVHCCAARPAATVCWGSDENGQIGDGTQERGQPLAYLVQTSDAGDEFLEDMVTIATGADHNCAAGSDGVPWCWGENVAGESGQNTAISELLFARSMDSLADVERLAAGHAYTCAVRDSGQLVCWGNNSNFELGRDGSFSPDPTPAGATSPIDVSGGAGFTCIVDQDGHVECVGRTTGMVLGQSFPDDKTSTFQRVPL